MKFSEHRGKWNNCQGCELYNKRKHVVLARGEIPCDVLFIGEAPGASEDVLGQPFVGPAGQLLDRIVARARGQRGIRAAFTNLVACIPLGDDGKKTAEPSVESIEACSPRLDEMWTMAQPRGIVFVGKLAQQHLADIVDGRQIANTLITHPAAILRAKEEQQGLLIQTAIVTVADLFYDIGVK